MVPRKRSWLTRIASELRHAEEQIALSKMYPGRAVPVEPPEPKSEFPTVWDKPQVRVIK